MTVSKFKVGDRVYASFRGYGTVTKIHEGKCVYPIIVTWDDTNGSFMEDANSFTEDGYLSQYFVTEDTILTVVNKKSKDECTVERMEDGLNKKVEDAVNPSHYKVEGLPEAIDIINHLMHREQYEGFLWGNILKYAYRFGRKGDKAETAGKIAWYATQLKELEERGYCE